MLMKRLLLSISALFLLTMFTLYAEQSDTPLPTFHTLSVSPHYGQMHYDINLYHLQDPDFDWLFRLSYTSDGFRPFAYSGQVGENWSLQAGGSISREIIGIADDTNDTMQKGLLTILRDSLFEPQTKVSIYNGSYDTGYWYSEKEHYTLDMQSDIYTFSFMDYYGRFFIGFDGKATILSGDFVDIDISQMT